MGAYRRIYRFDVAAIPLSLMTAQRVTNCYDLMDAAYCSSVLREHSRSLGHVPLIDHNPRRGEKIEFTLDRRRHSSSRAEKCGRFERLPRTPETCAQRLGSEYERYRKLPPEIGLKPQ
jgi:hypothetical protein